MFEPTFTTTFALCPTVLLRSVSIVGGAGLTATVTAFSVLLPSVSVAITLTFS